MVSIGFEVENNPFSGLTAGINEMKAKLGILDETESGLKDMSKEALTAGQSLEDLANTTHAPPMLDETIEKTKKTQKETKKAEITFTSLIGTMVKVGQTKLDVGLKGLTEGIKKPVTGMKDLAKHAKTLSNNIKTVGLPQALNTGLGKATVSAGKLLTKLKDVAGLGFQKAVSGMKSLTLEAGKAAGALGKGALRATGQLARGVSVGIAAAGTALAVGAVAAFSFGSAYETSLAKVSTMVDTSVMSVQELSGEVMSLSNKTGEGAAGLNEAVYQALSAGADTADVVGLVDVAVKAARGGFTDTTTAVDGLTSTLNAYGMETKDAEGLANSFLITQNKGKTTFGELASSIGGVAPTANAAGVGIDELLSGVASLTANGIGTSEAMTGIKAAMSNVIKPTAEASKVAKKLGLDFSTSALQSKGLAGFLGDVKTATGGNMDTMAQLFGSVEALNTVLTLTSDNGMALMQDTMNEMATNTTALDTAYETMSDTAQVSVQKGLNSFKNLGIGIYQDSQGIVADLTGLFSQSGSELYDAFTKGGFEGLVGQLGTTLSTALTTVTGYLPDLVEGGASVVDSLIDGITRNQDQIVGSLMDGLKSLAKGVIKILPKILIAGVGILTALVDGIAQNMPELITLALDAVQTLSEGLLANVPLLVQSGIRILNSLIDGLLQSAPLIVSSGVTLIMGLVTGLLSSVDLLIQGAVNLIMAIATGLLDNIPLLVQAAVSLVTGLVNGLVANIDLLINGAIALVIGLLTGILDNLPLLVEGAVQLVAALVVGLIQAIPLLIEAVPKLVEAIVNTVMNTDWLKLGGEIVTAIGKGLTNGIKSLFGTNKDGGLETMQGLADGIEEGTVLTESSADAASQGITAKIEHTNLYGSGEDIMSGLNNGMLSMQGTLNATAGGIGTGISRSLNNSLDIHSPSRVTEETGEFTGLGVVKGIKKTVGQVEAAGNEVGETTARSMTPFQSKYSPEVSSAGSTRTVNETNHFNPVFHLTLNGASASDSNERKVKRWVKDALKEGMESMGRSNPRLQEV